MSHRTPAMLTDDRPLAERLLTPVAALLILLLLLIGVLASRRDLTASGPMPAPHATAPAPFPTGTDADGFPTATTATEAIVVACARITGIDPQGALTVQQARSLATCIDRMRAALADTK